MARKQQEESMESNEKEVKELRELTDRIKQKGWNNLLRR